MSKKVEIVIDENADVHIDTIGFDGSTCEDIHSKLSNALGTVVDQKDKPEKYQKASIHRDQLNGN